MGTLNRISMVALFALGCGGGGAGGLDAAAGATAGGAGRSALGGASGGAGGSALGGDGVTSGDVVKATVVGNVITAYLNGVAVGTATDSTYATGSPGMGFNLETSTAACVGTNGDYGFTSFTATSD